MNLSPKRSTRSPKNDKVLKDLLPTWSPKSKRKISKRSPKKVSQTELFANQNIIHLGTKITPSSSMANSINTSHQNSPDRSSVHSKDSRRKPNRQLSIEDTTYPPSIEEFKRRTSSVSIRSAKIEEERNVKKCNSSPSRLQTSTRVSTPDDLYLDPKNNTINDETGVQLVDDSKYLSCLKDRTFSTEEDKTITEEDSPDKAWPEPPSKGYAVVEKTCETVKIKVFFQ